MAMTTNFSFLPLHSQPMSVLTGLSAANIAAADVDLAIFGNGAIYNPVQFSSGGAPTIQAYYLTSYGLDVSGYAWYAISFLHQKSQIESATLKNGNIVSVFLANDDPDDVRYRISTPSGGGIVIEAGMVFTGGTRNQPSVAALEGGGFVVAWQRNDLTDTQIYAKLYNQDGTPVGADNAFITVDGPGGAAAQNARVVGLTGGGFAVVYEQIDGSSASDIVARIYTAAGDPVGGLITVDNFGTVQGDIALSSRADGGFTITYRDNGWVGSGPTDITTISFSATGSVVRSWDGFGASITTSEDPDLARLSTDHTVLAYTTYQTSNGSDQDIVLRLLNPDGSPNSAQLTIGAAGVQRNASLAALSAGRFALAWVDEAAGATLFRTYALVNNATGDGTADSYVGLNTLSNSIFGLGGNDTLSGGQFNDTINGGDADDSLSGAGGNDLIAIGFGFNWADGGDGVDTIDLSFWGGGGTIDLANGTWRTAPGTPQTIINFEAAITGAGIDSLLGSNGGDLLDAGAGNDILSGGLGNDTLMGGDGSDVAFGGTGEDSIIGGLLSDTLEGGAGFDTLLGGDGDDSLLGQADGDVLEGGDGNDVLDGGGGSDSLTGGAGNDIFSMGTNESDSDTIRGGTGNDAVLISLDRGGGEIDGGDGVDILDVGLVSGNVTINFQTSQMFLPNNPEATAVSNFEFFYGAEFGNDSIRGTDSYRMIIVGFGGNDSLRGGDGATNDIVNGGAGDDVLFVSQGHDTIQGEFGNDVIVVGANIGGGNYSGGEDRDTLDLTLSGQAGLYTTIDLQAGLLLLPGGDPSTISGFEVVVGGIENESIIGVNGVSTRLEGGGGSDIIRGGDGPAGGWANDTILAGDGNDVIFASLGIDSVDGGAGDLDLYNGALWTVPVTVNLGAGTLVKGADTLALLNIESYIDGVGASSIVGTATRNGLAGGNGADTLRGLDGQDTLSGGAGADLLDGGADFDAAVYSESTVAITVFVDNPSAGTGDAAGDVFISIETFQLTNVAGAGDTFFGSANAETVFSTGGNDILYGNGGNDFLFGGEGNDFMLGGAGADLLSGEGGFDAVFYGDSPNAIMIDLQFSAVNTGFAAGDTFNSIEAFLLTQQNDLMRGRDDASAGDILYGLGGNDWLEGRGGFDYLLGGDGADTLNGAFGYDLFTGGTGADLFVYNNGFEGGAFAGGGEVITDFQSGVDKIAFIGATSGFASFSLGANLFLQTSGPTGTQGTTNGPTLIYDRTAGALWFDSNGNQAGGLNYLASLLNTPTLTGADFIVI